MHSSRCHSVFTVILFAAYVIISSAGSSVSQSYAANNTSQTITVECDNITFGECVNKISILSNVKIDTVSALAGAKVRLKETGKSPVYCINQLLGSLGIEYYAVNEDRERKEISIILLKNIEDHSQQGKDSGGPSPREDINPSTAGSDLDAECAPGLTCRQLHIFQEQSLYRLPSPDEECAPGLTCRQLEEIQEKSRQVTFGPDDECAPGLTCRQLKDIQEKSKQVTFGPDDECAPGLTCRQLEAIQKKSKEEQSKWGKSSMPRASSEDGSQEMQKKPLAP